MMKAIGLRRVSGVSEKRVGDQCDCGMCKNLNHRKKQLIRVYTDFMIILF